MRFIFRADASQEIGSGHVMRSSVLAEEAISQGFECIFVGRILDLDWVSERISKLGFSQVHSDQDTFVANAESDVLILDSYSIPISDPFIAKKNWKKIMCISDEITPKYESDLELRPGLAKVDLEQDLPTVLSGADHILIRKGIVKSKREKKLGGTLKVLVVGGGSDSFGFVAAIAEVVSSMKLDLEVHVFTNRVIPDDSEVRFVEHIIGSELDLIANSVDLVLTTASTSSLEFIAREIPTGVGCAVDNQREYYEQFGRLGYVTQIGTRNSNGNWEFKFQEIRELLENQGRRDSLMKATRMLIDLKGAKRVLDKLVSLSDSFED
jgi:spore coat polysaccharide biosynthesis predicted glycosyltransferase SpsG